MLSHSQYLSVRDALQARDLRYIEGFGLCTAAIDQHYRWCERASSKACASCKSAVSHPSVNQA
jgi:hypothetical protein